ncbi:hypothetical protein CDZ96_25900 [Mameliella alba]|nr:hypothetical protein CDZ96_25900 [Mameliella alba]
MGGDCHIPLTGSQSHEDSFQFFQCTAYMMRSVLFLIRLITAFGVYTTDLVVIFLLYYFQPLGQHVAPVGDRPSIVRKSIDVVEKRTK